MSSDPWEELQALKSKRDSRRKRIEERKKVLLHPGHLIKPETSSLSGGDTEDANVANVSIKREDVDWTGSLEEEVLSSLSDVALHLPIDSRQLLQTVNKTLPSAVQHNQITNLLQKFAVQLLISIEEKVCDEGTFLEIISTDHTKLSAMIALDGNSSPTNISPSKRRKEESLSEEVGESSGHLPLPRNMTTTIDEKPKEDDVLSLLSLASTREKENKRIGEEILELLSRPSAKEKTLAERFRSGGTVVKEFCPQGTKSECRRVSSNSKPCGRLHFRKIIQSHTDETLGDCSFLNTCFHMESCKYVHYEVDSAVPVPSSSSENKNPTVGESSSKESEGNKNNSQNELNVVEAETKSVLFYPQWIYCDLRYFDMTILGKFSVIMADPPWDIHMELPYGTLSDDEMRQLNIPALQDEGLIFLWVTGRAMELGRECLELWGYERVDELIWVKTNQLQRHWLNHGKEHCLVGMKGNPPVNRGLDCDIIVAEVRATSHKPDEIYGIIERLSPGTRKIELFGRPHNIQPNWITLGNQLEGSHIVDDEVRKRFFDRYPDGNCTVVKAK